MGTGLLLRDLVPRGQQLSCQPGMLGQPQSPEMSTMLPKSHPHGTLCSPGKEGDALGRGSTPNQPSHSVPETLDQTLPSGDQMTDKTLWLWFWWCGSQLRGGSWGTRTRSPMGQGAVAWDVSTLHPAPGDSGLGTQESPRSLGLLLPRAVPTSGQAPGGEPADPETPDGAAPPEVGLRSPLLLPQRWPRLAEAGSPLRALPPRNLGGSLWALLESGHRGG